MVQQQFEKADQSADWEEYQRWLAEKNRNLRLGTRAVILGIILRVLAIPLPPIGDEGAQFMVGLALWVATTGLLFWGGMRICRAKGRSEAFALFVAIGPFLLNDHNVREVPNKPGTGAKKEGAAFSDW
jgi:hypothetical protein